MDEANNIVTLPDLQAEENRQRLKITPIAEDLNNLAVGLKRSGKFHSALIAMQRAVAICPDSGFLWNGLGSVLWNLTRYDEAERALLQSAKLLGENDSSPLMNIGMMYSSIGAVDEALSYLKRACEANPEDPHCQWSYSLALLDHGHWEQGFIEYESRIQFRGPKYYPRMPYPMWKGEDLNYKTLFIQAEQGVGDRILFSRYFTWLAETWPHATIKCLISSADQISMEGLLWGFADLYGIEFLHHGIPWPKADYGIFLMSLAQIHGTTPNNVPPDPGIILERCKAESKVVNVPEPHLPALKIGISWTGNPIMARNHERSIPPEILFELEADPEVQLYSLQFGDDGLHRLDASQLICDCATDIGNRGLLGTATVMLNMDLIITCCTANAHLAGALGVPTWVLLCYDPYWTWLRGRDDSVWYPSVRLFRQAFPGDWRGVIDRVKVELRSLIQARRPAAAAVR